MEILAWVLSGISALTLSQLIASLLVLLTFYYWPIWNRNRYPPGPLPLPFIGNSLFFLKDNFMKDLAELRDVFGEVVTLYVGNTPSVVLNSLESVLEVLVKNSDHIRNRPTPDPFHKILGGPGYFGAKDGDWQVLRKQLLTIFKEHGVGGVAMEEQIKDELAYFNKELISLQGQSVDLDNIFKQSLSNVITRIVFGQRFEYSKEQVDNLQIEPYVEKVRLMAFLPFLKLIPGDPFGYFAAKERYFGTAVSFAKQQIDEHKRTLDMGSPRDFIDAFLIEMNNKTHPAYQDESTLVVEVMQLYIAGTDTTSIHLYCSLAYMVHDLAIQERIYHEIQTHIGERAPVYADRNLMPYTMSFMTEILRLGNALTTLPYLPSDDICVRGQIIPKGTILRANIWGACHDPALYSDPNTFKPDRFINEDGEYEKPDSKTFIAFGAGKRVCPGEPLARMEFFLFLISIVQKFRIRNGQEQLPNLKQKMQFILKLQPFKVVLTPRIAA